MTDAEPLPPLATMSEAELADQLRRERLEASIMTGRMVRKHCIRFDAMLKPEVRETALNPWVYMLAGMIGGILLMVSGAAFTKFVLMS